MKTRILTPDEIADIVARYTAEPGATIDQIRIRHRTNNRIIKAALVEAGVSIHKEKRDPNTGPAKAFPGLGPQLTRAERVRNQHQGLKPRVGR